MTTPPKVSVLIPTYNGADYLAEAIDSVLAQSFADFELIIVDNHSTDNTGEIVEIYLRDNRVKYFKNDTNIGMVNNWNKCLSYASGEYIKFLLADDLFHPDLLLRFVEVMDAYPQVMLTTSNKVGFGAKSFTWQVPVSYLQSGKKMIKATLKDCNWFGEATTVMFRRSGLSVGPFNNNYHYFPDFDMWLRLLTIGDCYLIPETLSYFRFHDKQVTSIVLGNLSNHLEEYEFFKHIQKNNPYQINLKELDIDKLVKDKVLACGRVILKILPKIHHKKNRIIFKKSLKIVLKENGLPGLLASVFNKKSTYYLKQVYGKRTVEV